MEWYWGIDVDDLVVPRDRDEESFERISSPNTCPLWDATAAFGFGSCFPKKNLLFNVGHRQDQDLLDFNGKNYNGMMNINYSVQERGHLDYDDSTLKCPGPGGLYLHDEEAQARTDRMDDIFFKSLLEENGTGEDNHNPSGNMFNDIILEQQYIPSDSHNLGSSKYLKTHDFSPPMDWENAEVSSTCPFEASLNDFTGEETFLEASVLQDLERVSSLFTEKTRICFRDALYRLAENSKQPSHMSQDGDIIMESHPILTDDDENSRSEETEVQEMKTNGIDRAIAGLMFSRMNFTDEEDNTTTEDEFKFICSTISYCQQLTRLAEDAEVPLVPC